MSREAAISYQWIFKHDGYGIARYRAATKIAAVGGFRYRSEAARARRKEQTRARRAQPRRDYRAWRIWQGESSDWAGQRVLAPPPLLPANSTLTRSVGSQPNLSMRRQGRHGSEPMCNVILIPVTSLNNPGYIPRLK